MASPRTRKPPETPEERERLRQLDLERQRRYREKNREQRRALERASDQRRRAEDPEGYYARKKAARIKRRLTQPERVRAQEAAQRLRRMERDIDGWKARQREKARRRYARNAETYRESYRQRYARMRASLGFDVSVIDRDRIGDELRAQMRRKLLADEVYAAANKAVPYGMPSFMRDDILSDICLAVLGGEYDIADIPLHARKISARHRKEIGKGALISLDAPRFSDGAQTLHDTVSRGLWQ
jgi:hypothetical protein